MARWTSCNILQVAPDAKRLWQFDAKGGGYALARELRIPQAQPLPAKFVAKSMASIWQPRLNVAWLPPESTFLRVVELPASNAGETQAMVELQLEKLSPLPVNQIVWTTHPLGLRTTEARGDAPPEHLQLLAVVMVERKVVEEFLGRLERDGFFADRLEAPMLDQLEIANGDGAWLFPLGFGGQSAALVAWRSGHALRHLSFISLPATGDRATELKNQLAHLVWAGELEGWLTEPPAWHLVADPAAAADWQNLLQTGLGEPVTTVAPAATAELAARTAARATSATGATLLPTDFSTRYHQQFVDRLWLRSLAYLGALYVVGLVIYFCAVGLLGYRTTGVERQVAAVSDGYTNSLQLKARLDVLKERQKLKYAALDCWQLVADQLPASISLQRFSFADGQKLALSGTAPEDQVNTLFDFNTNLRKVKVNGQPVFDPQAGETVNPRKNGPTTQAWNLSLELLQTEAE